MPKSVPLENGKAEMLIGKGFQILLHFPGHKKTYQNDRVIIKMREGNFY